MNHRKISFGEFEIDPRARKLTRGSEEIRLSPKAFDLLAFLAANPGRVISKDEILESVWDGQFVEESNLAVQISSLRKALSDRKESPRILATIPGKGYEFIADVGADIEIVVESRKFSKVVIDDSNGSGEPSTFDSQTQQRPSRGWMPALGAVGAIALVIGALGAYLLLFRANADRSSPLNLQEFETNRMTATGRVAIAAAISPDGKLFAFSQFESGEQSLWLGHADGGELRELRARASINYTGLRFAPDGSHLYFVGADGRGGRALFRMPVFGGPPELIKENVWHNIAFDPTGKKFAFVGNEDRALRVSDFTGSEDLELAKAPTRIGFVQSSQSWSPDGANVAVAASTNDSGTEHEIFIVDTAKGSVKPLTSQKWSKIDNTEWVRDGTGLIAIATENDSRLAQLWHVSFPGGEVRPLTSDLNIYEAAVALSDSNDALLAIQLQQFSNIWVGPSEDPAQASQITFGSLGRIDGWSGLDWTGDGRIVYAAVVEKMSSIWTMDADGQNQRQITPTGQSCFHPSVSSDGRTIAFTSVRDGDYSIWRANGDGSSLTKLTDAEIAAQPHISPDGQWIVYVAGSRDSFGSLYRIPAAGGEPTSLTRSRASWPRVSPDSKFIAAAFEIDGKSKLGILSIDGGEALKLFDVPRSANFRLGVRWSPDGKSIAYRDWINGIWRQDLDGGAAERIAGLPSEKLYAFGWSPDGKQFAFVRGSEIRDVVMMRRNVARSAN